MLNSKDVAFMATIKVIIRLVDDNDCAIGHHRRNEFWSDCRKAILGDREGITVIGR